MSNSPRNVKKNIAGDGNFYTVHAYNTHYTKGEGCYTKVLKMFTYALLLQHKLYN